MKIFQFIVEHWEPIAVLLGAIFARDRERGALLKKLNDADRAIRNLKGNCDQ